MFFLSVVCLKPSFSPLSHDRCDGLLRVNSFQCGYIFTKKNLSLNCHYAIFCLDVPSTIKAPCKRTQHCWPTTPNIVGCYMLRPFAHPVACFWMLLRVVAQSLKAVKLFSQQLPTFLLFRDRRSVAQQCWIRLHSSSFTGEKRLIGRRATT